jgi:hypothetical protein
MSSHVPQEVEVIPNDGGREHLDDSALLADVQSQLDSGLLGEFSLDDIREAVEALCPDPFVNAAARTPLGRAYQILSVIHYKHLPSTSWQRIEPAGEVAASLLYSKQTTAIPSGASEAASDDLPHG